MKFIPTTASAQELLNHIVIEYFKDQKRKHIARWVRRGLWALFLVGLGLFLWQAHAQNQALRLKPHVGLIDIKGEIADGQAASADNLSKSLKAAYASKGLQAIVLRIDSPGGSPVQADYMFNAVRYYRKVHPHIKYYAVCVDSCASAAYYIAAAADQIYANPSSLVGSIGVLYNGFGFVDALRKLGVTRRLETAGSNKGFMDQFLPINPQQEKNLQTMLDVIHQHFIAQVKLGRGARLQQNNPELFSGMIWTGTQAQALGLIDGFASTGQLLRDVIKIKVAFDYTEKHSVLEQLAKNLGASMINELPKAFGIRPGIH